MPIDILMPALSPTMEQGTLAKWYVRAGDLVRAGDVIGEIETDKATMELEAVDEGAIGDILVAAGTEGVKVNTPIARLIVEDGRGAPASEPQTKAGPEAAGAHASAAANSVAERPPSPVASPAVAKANVERPAFASPLARRIAEQKGLDLSTITGSGPHGRILKVDVDGAPRGHANASGVPVERAARPSSTAPDIARPRQVRSLEEQGVALGGYHLIALDGMRKTVAQRMTDSFRDVPHFPLTIDLEIDALLGMRAKINALIEKTGVKISVNDMVIKACAVALMQVPEANASYTPEGIAMHRHADIAIAVAVPGGLITPIIRAAETKGLSTIAMETKDLAERARAKKLKPEEFQGGTFSISNLGMFGIKSFSSIINEPHGAILSVGVGEKRPVVRGDRLAIATVMSVTLTCDHRVVDGATGARFLAALRPLILDPLLTLV